MTSFRGFAEQAIDTVVESELTPRTIKSKIINKRMRKAAENEKWYELQKLYDDHQSEGLSPQQINKLYARFGQQNDLHSGQKLFEVTGMKPSADIPDIEVMVRKEGIESKVLDKYTSKGFLGTKYNVAVDMELPNGKRTIQRVRVKESEFIRIREGSVYTISVPVFRRCRPHGKETSEYMFFPD